MKIATHVAGLSALLLPLAAALALNLGTPTAGAALPKEGGNPDCSCQCNTGSGPQVPVVITHTVAQCSQYEGKTCNFEDANGVLHTGTVSVCDPVTGPNGRTVIRSDIAGVRSRTVAPSSNQPSNSTSSSSSQTAP